MSVNKLQSYKIDLTEATPFEAAWVLDGLCNSCTNGVNSNAMKACDLMAEAKKILGGNNANEEIQQTKLGRLADRIEMHENQEAWFKLTLEAASSSWCAVTGKPEWHPYSKANPKSMRSHTDTNEFFAKRKAV